MVARTRVHQRTAQRLSCLRQSRRNWVNCLAIVWDVLGPRVEQRQRSSWDVVIKGFSYEAFDGLRVEPQTSISA